MTGRMGVSIVAAMTLMLASCALIDWQAFTAGGPATGLERFERQLQRELEVCAGFEDPGFAARVAKLLPSGISGTRYGGVYHGCVIPRSGSDLGRIVVDRTGIALQCRTPPTVVRDDAREWRVYPCDDGLELLVVSTAEAPTEPVYVVVEPSADAYVAPVDPRNIPASRIRAIGVDFEAVEGIAGTESLHGIFLALLGCGLLFALIATLDGSLGMLAVGFRRMVRAA